MDTIIDGAGQGRLGEYFSRVGDVLNNKRRMASFAQYAMGLLGDGERKSMEPIAARACPDPRRVEDYHQRLGHFIADSRWSDRGVRRVAARYCIAAMTERERIDTWIIDDTGFLKQGRHSVGVQRQYTGSAGKIANCQIGVSLSVATRTEHAPIDFELYLPRSWTEDPERRKEGRIPDDVQFKTKPELALGMIRRAAEDGIPYGIVLADTAYGTSSAFRLELRRMGFDYAVAVDSTTKVWQLDRLARRYGEAISVKDLGCHLARRKAFRKTTWRQGTKHNLWAKFVALRVVPIHDDGIDPGHREDVWLLCEWPPDESAPTKFYFSTLPRSTTRKQLVRTIKERWRTERVYQDLKGELGLDHFEGRRFPGWHHHVSVALCCYAFVIAERVRRFPPTATRQVGDDSISLPA
jgi:SRSO17 transposase